MTTLLLGATLRVIQAAAFSAPYVLCGLFITGVLRRFLGADGTKRLFGGDTWRSLPQSWLMGMLLPVCSIGVIPIISELRRSRLSAGAILAFALSAPLFNPISILYGLTLSHPSVILIFSLCSLVLVTLIGAVWGRWLPTPAAETAAVATIDVGWKRVLAVLLTFPREMAGPTLGFVLLALVGVAGVSLCLPFGYLQYSMFHEDPKSPLIMGAVALPIYVTPTAVMGQLGSMFDHGNSIGAALVLLTIGAGANVGLVGWMVKNDGVKATLGMLALLFVVVLTLAYAIEEPLYYAGANQPGDHTHAFDMYCCPFPLAEPNPVAIIKEKLASTVGQHEWTALQILAGCLVVGLLLKVVDRFVVVEEWLERPSPPTTTGRWDFVLPGMAIGVAALVGVIAFSIYGCYIYYPHPDETFQQINMVKAEALLEARRLNDEQAEWWILYFDDLTRKVQAGAFIRGYVITPALQSTSQELRHQLDELRHAVDDEETEVIERLFHSIPKSTSAFRAAFDACPRRW